MSDDVVRVTCANSDCGTFVMDRALRDKLQRTGNTFTCPAGHEQHFTESVEARLRERIEELETRVDRLKKSRESLKEDAHRQWDEWREEQRRRKATEKALLERVDGVVEIAEEEWMWACECGGHARKRFETEDDAEAALRNHRRQSCDRATDGGVAADA